MRGKISGCDSFLRERTREGQNARIKG